MNSDFGRSGSPSLVMFIAAISIAVAGTIETAMGEDRLAGFPSLVLGGQTTTAQNQQFQSPFDNLIDAGSFKIVLEKTAMADIRDTFGGSLQSHTLPDASASWLCYELIDNNLKRRIWFIAEGVNPSGGCPTPVNFVSTELVDDHIKGCDAPNIDLAAIVLPVPALKDDSQMLGERFGAVPENGMVRYSNERRNENDETIVQSLVYRLQGGKINAIAFSQATSQR
ncbi:hypothetical protein [Brucella thiophenivorans]|nr:hypothetical protein [Brucella thiophenivorans]